MEGIFKRENVTRATNIVCWSVTCVFVGLSAMVSLQRNSLNQHAIDVDRIFGSFEAEPVDERNVTRLLDLVGPTLKRKGVGINDLINAASHVVPIESDLRNLDILLDSIQPMSSDARLPPVRDPQMQSILANSISQGGPTDSIRERIVNAVCDKWINRGYFRKHAFPNRSVFGNRETSEAVGIDIGCTVSTSLDLTTSDVHQLTNENLHAATRAFERWGFILLRNAVSQHAVSALIHHLNLTQGSASENGQSILKHDPNISHNRAMVNRLQLLIRGSKIESCTKDWHAAIVPLLTILHRCRPTEGGELMLSDIRLIIVDEGADKGNWSIFNPRGGFTVILPLHDRDSRTGTYQIVPGSHFIADQKLPFLRRVSLSIQRLVDSPFPISVSELNRDGCWRAGDALVLDNRVLIKPEENKVFRSGTYLLMKYETAQSAPPQIFPGGKILFRFAQFLDELSAWVTPRL